MSDKEDIIKPVKGKKETKTKLPKQLKFKIILTEEEQKKRDEKIRAANEKGMKRTIQFFKNKGMKTETDIDRKKRLKILDNTFRTFLFSITYDKEGKPLILSDAEYINKIQLFIKRENLEIITKIFNDILNKEIVVFCEPELPKNSQIDDENEYVLFYNGFNKGNEYIYGESIYKKVVEELPYFNFIYSNDKSYRCRIL